MKTNLTLPSIFLLVTSAITLLSPVAAAEVEGFTEPYRRIAVPAPEIGTIQELLVAEGDEVAKGQSLARMDNAVLIAALEVARAAKDSKGSLRSAEAALEARKKQYESYQSLHERGNATQRESDRAENEFIQAQGHLQSVREELEVRRLEFERAKAQLAHRQIKSPINGFVVVIEKEAGEFVSPSDPIVMHIVQIDTLKTVFSVPLDFVGKLKVGQQCNLTVGREKTKYRGTIEFVSPIADAQTASVAIKIRIPNFDGKIQSGAMCVWDLNVQEPDEQISSHRMPKVF